MRTKMLPLVGLLFAAGAASALGVGLMISPDQNGRDGWKSFLDLPVSIKEGAQQMGVTLPAALDLTDIEGLATSGYPNVELRDRSVASFQSKGAIVLGNSERDPLSVLILFPWDDKTLQDEMRLCAAHEQIRLPDDLDGYGNYKFTIYGDAESKRLSQDMLADWVEVYCNEEKDPLTVMILCPWDEERLTKQLKGAAKMMGIELQVPMAQIKGFDIVMFKDGATTTEYILKLPKSTVPLWNEKKPNKLLLLYLR